MTDAQSAIVLLQLYGKLEKSVHVRTDFAGISYDVEFLFLKRFWQRTIDFHHIYEHPIPFVNFHWSLIKELKEEWDCPKIKRTYLLCFLQVYHERKSFHFS